jgi:glycosyltransferase involved in cell wall biosynthesis
MANKRIAHVIESLAHEMGGPPAALRQLAERQSNSGNEVSILHRGPNELNDFGAHVRVRPSTSITRIDSKHDMIQEIKSCATELVHAHGVWDPTVRWSIIAARQQGVPVVLSTHGMLHPLALKRHGLRKRTYLRTFRSICTWPTTFICLNSEEAAWAETKLRVRTAVIGHGIASEEFVDRPSRITAAHFAPVEPPYLLFVGRLDRIKGIDLLIDAFSRCDSSREVKLVIAGPDHGQLRHLTRQCYSLGIQERVVFLGSVDRPTIRRLLGNAMLFVHRPRYEGFGIAVAEALAGWAPVLTTKACKLPGAAEAGALHLSADDAPSFANEIDALVRDAKMRTTLSETGRRWAEANLTWQSVLRQHDEVYAHALRSKHT